MVDKKLHLCYIQKIKILQVIDINGYIFNVAIEWE